MNVTVDGVWVLSWTLALRCRLLRECYEIFVIFSAWSHDILVVFNLGGISINFNYPTTQKLRNFLLWLIVSQIHLKIVHQTQYSKIYTRGDSEKNSHFSVVYFLISDFLKLDISKWTVLTNLKFLHLTGVRTHTFSCKKTGNM